ncbi:MAG: hypothetical protein MJ231_02690 [bacterium]|nr:hypothetical protein [bacterium]
MRKLILTLIIISLALPTQAAFWTKKDKALEVEMEGKGYAGTLPDLSKVFQKDEKKVGKPVFDAQKDFNDPSELKPIPRDNPSFVNIIQKKDKTSNYVIDANEIIPIIEKLVDCIEDNANVQLFVTRANVLTMNLDYLMDKYQGKPESYYQSFKKLMEVNQYTKSIAQLRREAVTYQRYLAYQSTGSIYNPENINQQLEYLKEELNTAILMLKEEE